MLTIPVVATPSQDLNVLLANQICRLKIYTKERGLFMDVFVNDVLIIGGVICLNANAIVRSAYLGFVGDLMFIDTQGTDSPDYAGLGTRFILLYLEASDL